jgi:catechol 2,3-dioxygenase-like lactoylglutathione lyase family enzyme
VFTLDDDPGCSRLRRGIVVLMSIRRVVPDMTTQRLEESREFYVGLLGFEVAMDMDWVVTLVSPVNPTAQVILMTRDATAPVQPQISIEVANVDAVHQDAVNRGDDIIYPLTDEPWGVRRFFVRDPTGVVVNVLAHQSQDENVDHS